MAFKIGKYYITKNNPRELLNIIREQEDINRIKDFGYLKSKNHTDILLKQNTLYGQAYDVIKSLANKETTYLNYPLETYYSLIIEYIDKLESLIGEVEK